MRFADTSFWLGLHTAADPRHVDAAALWREGMDRVLTSELVLGETWTLLRLRRTAHPLAVAFLDAVRSSSRVEVAPVDPTVAHEAWTWLRRHDEHVYSFVDATSFAIMRRRRVTAALAFDGDFTAAGFIEVRP